MVSPLRGKLLLATTVPETPWTIMRGQLRYLADEGFDTLLVSSPGVLLDATAARECVRTVGVPMRREIRLRDDLRSLRSLVRLFRSERPDIAMVSTPKAGLLAGLAALFTRVPRRVYVLFGLRLETASGPYRALLWAMEWVAIHSAHEVVAVSPSLLSRARELRLIAWRRGVVLGHGASCGVDLERFVATPHRQHEATALRERMGIPADAFVFGFVGRLTVDKGIRELANAFSRLVGSQPNVWLLIVGAEDGPGLPPRVRDVMRNCANVSHTGWLLEPDITFHAMDVLVLPTYREGLPNACLEAAAAGKAVITTTATGARDAIDPGHTGLLVPPRDSDALHSAMRDLATNPGRAAKLGSAGPTFVAQRFTTERVWAELNTFLSSGSSAGRRGIVRVRMRMGGRSIRAKSDRSI